MKPNACRLVAALLGVLVSAQMGAAQGYANLGSTAAEGFAQPQRGTLLQFPADHGAHPRYRIEWWYVTANLVTETGVDLGIQWHFHIYFIAI